MQGHQSIDINECELYKQSLDLSLASGIFTTNAFYPLSDPYMNFNPNKHRSL